MCSPTWETRIPCDMFFLPRKHISLVICVPLPGKHLSTWETHIACDMFFPTQETHITSYMCSPTWETRIPCDMCSLINVMRSFSPRDCKFFFFCFTFLIEPFVL